MDLTLVEMGYAALYCLLCRHASCVSNIFTGDHACFKFHHRTAKVRDKACTPCCLQNISGWLEIWTFLTKTAILYLMESQRFASRELVLLGKRTCADHFVVNYTFYPASTSCFGFPLTPLTISQVVTCLCISCRGLVLLQMLKWHHTD